MEKMDADARALKVLADWKGQEYGCEAQKNAVLQCLIIEALQEHCRAEISDMKVQIIDLKACLRTCASSAQGGLDQYPTLRSE